MAPLLPLHPCGLTRVKPLSEGRFIHVWCLPVGSFARSHVELWGGFRQSKERLQVPKEQEAGAAEQDLSSSCSAPHAGIPTSHPGLQSSIHTRAAPCSLQAWSCFLLCLLANVWLVPAPMRKGLQRPRWCLPPQPAPPAPSWWKGRSGPWGAVHPPLTNISASQEHQRTAGTQLSNSIQSPWVALPPLHEPKA